MIGLRRKPERFLRKWNSSRFEGGVRYLYEPNFDATAKDYESWQDARFVLNASSIWLIQVQFGLIVCHCRIAQEWFGGVTMVQLTLNHIDASLG